MRNITIREKLYDYIRFADEKKVKAIYTMVQEEIEAKTEIWHEPEFILELDRRVTDYENGDVEMSTWEEVKAKTRTLKD